MPVRDRQQSQPVSRSAGAARSGGSAWRRPHRALAALAIAMIAASPAGCAKMNAALGQQWVEVQLAPATTVAAAQRIASACSHVPDMKPYPIVKSSSYANLAGTLRFHATRATPAQMAQLQVCLQRFPAVQGFTVRQPGSDG